MSSSPTGFDREDLIVVISVNGFGYFTSWGTGLAFEPRWFRGVGSRIPEYVIGSLRTHMTTLPRVSVGSPQQECVGLGQYQHLFAL